MMMREYVFITNDKWGMQMCVSGSCDNRKWNNEYRK